MSREGIDMTDSEGINLEKGVKRMETTPGEETATPAEPEPATPTSEPEPAPGEGEGETPAEPQE